MKHFGRKNFKRVVITGALLVAIGFGMASLVWSQRGLSLEGASLMGFRAAWLVSGSPRVQILRLSDDFTQEKTGAHIGRYLITQRRELNANDATQIRSALIEHFNERSYSDFETHACNENPGIAFRFGNGDKHVDLLTCLFCGELSINASGKPRIWEDCDAQRATFRAIAKRAFPNDAELEQS